MPVDVLSPIDTRELFRPVSAELVTLLGTLSPSDWEQPTVAGSWRVRDVVAHLIDLTYRRLSFHRDGMTPPPPPFPIASDHDFVRFINTINAQWVSVTARFSPRVLTELFERAGLDLADWFEALPLEAPALFGVSWAGEQKSEGWFDVGREFTELWHHQEQIRMAVGAPSLPDPRYLRAVLGVAVRGLPHAFRDVPAARGQSITLDVSGPSGGRWTLLRDEHRWVMVTGEPKASTTRIRMADVVLWKLLFNALSEIEKVEAIHIEGQQELGTPLFRARSVIV